MGDTPQEAGGTFGWELILDLHGCNPNKVRSREEMVAFVVKLCDEVLGVKRYGDPWAERFGLAKPETAGYTVVQLVETSSVVAHFSELKSSVYFEIFSCEPYDPVAVREFCCQFFQAEMVIEHFVERK